MSAIEDIRQGFQDFLAPELRALVARLEALEKVMSARFDTMDSRFGAQNAKLDALESRMADRFNSIIDALAIDRRLSRLEAAQQQSPTTPQ